MKTLLTGLLFASLMVVATGCGKDSGGGSSSNKTASPATAPTSYSNLNLSKLSVTSQQVFQRLQAWHKGSVEGQMFTGIVDITKTKYVYTVEMDCEQKVILKYVLSVQYCDQDQNVDESILSEQDNVNLFATKGAISSKGNQELNGIFSGTSGQITNAIDIAPNVSQVDFRRNDGVVTSYIIDRNRHSLLNPVRKTVYSQASQAVIEITAQRIY